jgi:hypothetical protein
MIRDESEAPAFPSRRDPGVEELTRVIEIDAFDLFDEPAPRVLAFRVHAVPDSRDCIGAAAANLEFFQDTQSGIEFSYASEGATEPAHVLVEFVERRRRKAAVENWNHRTRATRRDTRVVNRVDGGIAQRGQTRRDLRNLLVNQELRLEARM